MIGGVVSCDAKRTAASSWRSKATRVCIAIATVACLLFAAAVLPSPRCAASHQCSLCDFGSALCACPQAREYTSQTAYACTASGRNNTEAQHPGSQSRPSAAPRIALLLTCYSRHTKPPHASRARNRDRVKWWLDNSAFHLFVIDSANSTELIPRKFQKSPRLRVVRFQQPTVRSSTDGEMRSLRIAFKQVPEMLEYDYIFKLTGKYVLPGFSIAMDRLLRHPLPEMVVQQPAGVWGLRLAHESQLWHRWWSRWWGNYVPYTSTELFGMRTDVASEILNELGVLSGIMEHRVYAAARKRSVAWLPRLLVEPRFRTPRGDSRVLNYL